MHSSLFELLKKLSLTSLETRTLFNNRTRDVNELKVWKDKLSGIIYIDEYYVGDSTYETGSYVEQEINLLHNGHRPFEQITDAKRRVSQNLKFVSGKRLLDFGCGSGDFLRLVREHCKELIGIELQKNYLEALNSEGILCLDNLEKVQNNSIDVCVSFHVLEHLPDPVEVLTSIKKKLVSGGSLILEVPHANDFLLSRLSSEDYKQFTLWSQHLLLHTRVIAAYFRLCRF